MACPSARRSLVLILLTVAVMGLTTTAAQSNTTVNHNATAGSQGLGAAATVRDEDGMTSLEVHASGVDDHPCCMCRTHLLITPRTLRPSASSLQDATRTET